MNVAEIGNIAYNAGIKTQSDLQAAIAIAMAESGGNPNAVGDVGLQTAEWGPSLGLWQIRSLKAESGKGTQRDGTRLKDPAFNAASMFAISGGGKHWGPWSTWPLRAAVFMPMASPIATGIIARGGAQAAVGAVTDAVTAPLDGVKEIASVTHAGYNWISNRNNIFRLVKGGMGVNLVLVGLYIMGRPVINPAVGSVVKGTVKTVKTGAKVAAVVAK